ncbi:MAG TPA: hypothetical protein VGU74_09990 [Gemmatimonadales bacterium]|nr:hypothetical protein [Gemmatimonadales bacterium]
MRLSLRFVVPLFVALGIFAYAAVPLVNRLMLSWFSRDLEVRADLIANTVDDPLQELMQARNRRRVVQFFTRITQDERVLAVAFCPADNTDAIATPTLPKEVRCADLDRFAEGTGGGRLLQTATGPVYVSVRPIATIGRLALVHDMSFIARRSRETREYLFLFFVGLGLTVALITVAIAQLSWRGWEQGLRALLHGDTLLTAPGTTRGLGGGGGGAGHRRSCAPSRVTCAR